jgi:predicted transcriptional regulator of viral defense system
MSISPSYSQTLGLKLLQSIVEAHGPLFTLDQARVLAASQDLEPSQVVQKLSALTRGGWIVRLKRGLYAVQSPLFTGELHPFAIATTLIQPAAISHWSALAHHGMTTQIPSMVQVSTPHKVVTPEMRNGQAYRPRGRAVWKVLDVEIEFIQVKPAHFFGFVQEWVSAWHRVAISGKERTSLDMLAYPEIFGGVTIALEMFESQCSNIDITRLVEYALRYDIGSVIKRLGWMLETIGVPESFLEPLQAYPGQNDYPLDPQRPREGARSTRWRVINNLYQSQ